MQLSLFDSLPTVARRDFSGAQRLILGEGAWVELVPGWLSGADQLFHRVLAAADWEQHRRQMYDRTVDVPRLVAAKPGSGRAWAFPDEQTVSILPRLVAEATAQSVGGELEHLGRLLGERYGRVLGSISLAYYRDGRDSVAFHGDKLGELRPDTIVAILSLGSRRRFLMRRAGGGPSRTFTVGEGDLFVMGGSCQETWEHAVPKARAAGPRIAIMFREARAESRRRPVAVA